MNMSAWDKIVGKWADTIEVKSTSLLQDAEAFARVLGK